MPKVDGRSFDEVRYNTVMEGYKKSESMIIFKGLEWEDDPSMVNFLKAGFPFPPPECHTSFELPASIFVDDGYLGEVSEKLLAP